MVSDKTKQRIEDVLIGAYLGVVLTTILMVTIDYSPIPDRLPVKKIYQIYDTNKDGYLDKKELSNYLKDYKF